MADDAEHVETPRRRRPRRPDPVAVVVLVGVVAIVGWLTEQHPRWVEGVSVTLVLLYAAYQFARWSGLDDGEGCGRPILAGFGCAGSAIASASAVVGLAVLVAHPARRGDPGFVVLPLMAALGAACLWLLPDAARGSRFGGVGDALYFGTICGGLVPPALTLWILLQWALGV